MKIISNAVSQTNIAVTMKNATAIWDTPTPEQSPKTKKSKSKNEIYRMTNEFVEIDSPTLNNINVEFPKGILIGVIGPVGSGKSSFLQVILRELPLKDGTISVNGSLSYASQEPWVFAASVRQNILFGKEFDRDQYKSVVKSCALLPDFEQFENGDRSIIGEKGTLSGGQKARIKYF